MGEGMAWRSGHWRRMAYGGRRARHPRPPWATAALAERRWSTIVDRVRGGTGRIRYQWLLIVAIAAGLIGMHHLVAGHGGQEGQSAHTPMTIAAGPGLSLMSPTPTEHSHAGLAMNPVLARVAANSVLASHPCCCDPMDLVGHCWFGRLDGDDCPGRRIGLGDSMATTLGAGASAGRGRRRPRAGTAYRLRSIYPARRSEALMPLIDQRLIQPTHLRRGTSL